MRVACCGLRKILFLAAVLGSSFSIAALCVSQTLSIGALCMLLMWVGASCAAVWFSCFESFSYPIILLGMAYVAECLMQLQIEHYFELDFSYQRWIDYFIYLLVFWLFSTLSKRKSNGIILGNLFFFALSTINLAITVFRGKPVYFPDLYSVKTAIDVADAFSFPVSKVHLVSAFFVLL